MARTISPEAAHHRGRIAGLTRAVRNGERPADDPELDDARQSLAAARLASYIERTLADWPTLTTEQRDRLAQLLKPVAVGGAK